MGEAIWHLRGYVMLEPDDRAAKEKPAFALTDVAESASMWHEVFLFREQVLKDDPAQHELYRRLIEL